MQSHFSIKIIKDLAKAIKQDPGIDSFGIIGTGLVDKNTTPVLRSAQAVGLESWAVRHVLPFAHDIVLNAKIKKDEGTLAECVLVVNLLHPEMATAWSRRRELLLLGKLSAGDELRITHMALTAVPKCNEALAHRRWLMANNYVSTGRDVLIRELSLMDVIADRYPSNYHAWSHRQWCLRRFARSERVRAATSSPLKQPFSRNHFIHVYKSSPMPIYLRELESSSNFISAHVSDHSSLHHRSFLLGVIFSIIENVDDVVPDEENVPGNDDEACIFYSRLRQNAVTFVGESDESVVKEYLDKMSSHATVFDSILCILMGELTSNTTLNKMFEYHESLWCYRRFLIFNFCRYISAARLHLSSVLADSLETLLAINEQTWLNVMDMAKDSVEYDSRIFNNYCKWLKQVPKIDITINVK